MIAKELSQLAAAYRWLLHTEGSTRALALIRIGLVINVWARWGDEHVLYRDIHPETLTVGLVFFVSSTLALAGWFTRLSTAALAACTWYYVYIVGHVNGYEPYTHHHTTLLAWGCLLLAFSPSGKALSVDRYLAVRRAEKRGLGLPSEDANLWAQRLMCLQVVAVYLYGAIDKCNWGFLSGARMSHYLMYYYTGPQELSLVLPGADALMFVGAVSTVLLEFALAFGLFFRETRRLLILPGLLLHGIFYFGLSVFTFTTTMWVLYFAFLDPDELDAVIDKLLGRTASTGSAAPAPSTPGADGNSLSPNDGSFPPGAVQPKSER